MVINFYELIGIKRYVLRRVSYRNVNYTTINDVARSQYILIPKAGIGARCLSQTAMFMHKRPDSSLVNVSDLPPAANLNVLFPMCTYSIPIYTIASWHDLEHNHPDGRYLSNSSKVSIPIHNQSNE